MRLTFNDRWVGDDLAEYFRRSDCVVVHIGRRKLDVHPQQTLSPELATLELEGLLRVWRKLHPEASIIASGSFRGKAIVRLRHDCGAEERPSANPSNASSATRATRIRRRRA